jgi:hypothetical protein
MMHLDAGRSFVIPGFGFPSSLVIRASAFRAVCRTTVLRQSNR